MAKVENATKWAINIANDNSHGYDQLSRWGTPDYDCSSLVISAYEQAGIKVKTAGATYTGNMYNAFVKCGFDDVTTTVNLSTGAGLKRGDVLLNKTHHTAMFIGSGKLVEASINEKGTIMNGKPGDQTGNEIHTRSYYSYPWDCVLRYPEAGTYTTYYVKSAVNYRIGPGVNFAKKGEYAVGKSLKIEKGTDTKVGNDTWVLTSDGYWLCKEYLTTTKPDTATKVLDPTGFQYGAKNAGVLAYKELLIMAKAKGLITASVNEDQGFGNGTKDATNQLLKRWGYVQNGIMGPNIVKKLAKELSK